MPRCDTSVNVVSTVATNYESPRKRMKMSSLLQIFYHIQAQALTCVCKIKKPTVACRPFVRVVNLISKPRKHESKTYHLSTNSHLKKRLLYE